MNSLCAGRKVAGLLILVLISTGCGEQTDQQKSSVLAEGAVLTKISGNYEFDTAGSPLYLDGNYYFTNNNFEQPEMSMTLRKSISGDIDTLKTDNGVTTTLQASGNGTIYACEMLGHRVVELNKDGDVIRVVADQYNGNRIDGPNDLVTDNRGGLYFSDSQFIAGREKMQDTPAVYYVSPENEVIRIIDDIEFSNGMGISPDGSVLYVADTRGSHLLSYHINDDGTVTNKRNFAQLQLPEDVEESGADGLAVDSEGNVYVATTQGIGVQIFDSEGKHLENISAPTITNNVSFGGEEGKTILIAAEDGIYAIQGRISEYSPF